ncbi:hypothetical protein EYF80_054155 [Liparis tanakae]|uniref:Uncharacterized protein n=1 Tax=Liparis tanakae TaxID=230148 RepID=A0A4Z2F4P5_9TELE|nr:hypothetical protein EYF80_054155 [Liparis tanakae]
MSLFSATRTTSSQNIAIKRRHSAATPARNLRETEYLAEEYVKHRVELHLLPAERDGGGERELQSFLSEPTVFSSSRFSLSLRCVWNSS